MGYQNYFYLFIIVFIATFINNIQGDIINSPSLQVLKLLPDLITIEYSIQGGNTSYPIITDVYFDNTLDTSCSGNNINTTRCTFSNINFTPLQHNITIVFTNDLTIIPISKFVLLPTYLYKPIISNITKTTSVNFTIYSNGGDSSLITNYSISIVGPSSQASIICDQQQINISCLAFGLTPNTFYSFNITVYNGDQLNFTIFNTTTFPLIYNAALSTRIEISYYGYISIFLNATVSGGVPNITTYRTYLNGELIIFTCPPIECELYTVAQRTLFNVTVVFTNDNYTLIQQTFVFTPWSATRDIVTVIYATSYSVNLTSTIVGGNPALNTITFARFGVLAPECTQHGISVANCSFQNLTPATLQQFNVSVVNNGSNPFSKIPATRTLALMNSLILTPNITTRSLQVFYKTSDGYLPWRIIKVYLNGTLTDCGTLNCTWLGNESQSFNITVIANCEGVTLTNSKLYTIYKNISSPIITFSRNYNTLIAKWLTNFGVPGGSKYTVFLNDTLMPNCNNITISSCSFTDVNPGDYLNVRVDVYNDDDHSTNSKVYFVVDPITKVNVTLISDTSSINATWLDSTGGEPNMTTYYTYISYDQSYWRLLCMTPQLSCNFTNLVSNFTYYIKVSVSNSYFNQNTTITSTSTLPFLTSNCPIDNNTGLVCGGKGICNLGICNCQNDWSGLTCEWNMNGTSLGANFSIPTIDFGDGDGYILELGAFVERNSSGDEMARLLLSSLTWILIDDSVTNLSYPILNTNLTNPVQLHRRIYIVDGSTQKYASNIAITFMHYKDLPGTLNDTVAYTYTGQTYYQKLGATRYTMTITRWSFSGYGNTLQLETYIKTPNANCRAPEYLFDTSPTSMTTLSTVNVVEGRSVLAKFHNNILLDTIPVMTSHSFVKFNNFTATVITNIGYFVNIAFIDPEIAASQFNLPPICIVPNPNSDSNNESQSSWRIIVGVVVGAVGLAAIGATLILLYKKVIKPKLNSKKNAGIRRIDIDLPRIDQNKTD